MKNKISIQEQKLIDVLKKNMSENGNTTKSEALKALENGSRTAEDQIFLWKLGNDIRNLRLNVKLSQRQLAKILHTTPTNLRRIEKGERSVSVVNLYRILKELHSKYTITPEKNSYSEIYPKTSERIQKNNRIDYNVKFENLNMEVD